MADFFIKRPILSFCLSLIIVLLGAFSILRLPVSEYPDIIPPSIQVTATYPGADCETVVKSIASPIEQQMSGVDGMSYMTSVNTNNGQMSMMILFETGTEANMDQVLSYLRYGQATSQLPPEVSELGISLRKTSGLPALVISFYSPNGTYDGLWLANYAYINMVDAIKRVRLPAPRRLSPKLEKALDSRMNRTGLKYMPQVFENGWYCACGSFHPKEEDTVYCTECGCDRILLQNALNTLLQPEQPDPVPAAQSEAPVRPVQPAAQEEPTRIMSSAAQEEATRVMPARPHVEQAASFAPPLEPVEAGEQTRILDARNYQPAARAARPDDEGTRVMPAAVRDAAPAPQRAPEPQPVDEEDYEEEADSRDSIAETLIRWVPPITAIICAGIALWGFVYYQFIL